MHTPLQDTLLDRHLRTFLGPVDETAMSILRTHLSWVELPAGQTLMAQGEPGDAMYLSISGRLRAYVRDDDGVERRVREMARGQVIGEMSLYTDEPRSATVVAIRDSVLVRLGKAEFNHLLQSSVQASIALTRQLIARLQTVQTRTELAQPVTIGLLPITAGVGAAGLAERLAGQLRQQLGVASVCVVDAARVDRDLGSPGLARSRPADAGQALALNHRIAIYLDELEALHDYVLLLADDEPSAWTRRCSSRSDEILLLADATQPAVLHATESQFLLQRAGRAEAAEILVLLHPADRRCPQGTRQWLGRRPVSDHVHIRPALERDMARLARIQSRNATGLVFAGGGARGLAHLGIQQALRSRGIEIDFVGGTSIGAVMAALVASDRPLPEVMDVARRAFSVNPTGDFNLLPLISLISGQRLRRVVAGAAQEIFGCQPDIEDLWKNCYCVASNYSQAREAVVRSGPLLRGMLASMAIPGALPPVLVDGELLCDGGTFNNFPVDVMRAARGLGRVIGVDLSSRKARRIEFDELPTTWALLLDRLRARSRQRYKLPSLVSYLMNVTVMVSTSRQQQARKLVDLYFNPELGRVGMLEWTRFDHIVDQGRGHAQQVLDALPPEVLRPFQAKEVIQT